MRISWLWLAAFAASFVSANPITVKDDAGAVVRLSQPAQRIISLAPHATELLFAAGAGQKVVAVSEWSDFPAAATKLPKVSSVNGIQFEKVLALRPDLVVLWGSGQGQRDAERLRQLGLSVFLSEPRSLQAIADSLLRLGQLAGSTAQAQHAAQQFQQQWQQLQQRYASAQPRLSVFVQISARPLLTIGGRQFLSDLLRGCGGSNVFADVGLDAFPVLPEQVLRRQPQVMLTLGENTAALQQWQSWPQLPAIQQQQLYSLPADPLSRPGPRLVEGAKMLCHTLAQARSHFPP